MDKEDWDLNKEVLDEFLISAFRIFRIEDKSLFIVKSINQLSKQIKPGFTNYQPRGFLKFNNF